MAKINFNSDLYDFSAGVTGESAGDANDRELVVLLGDANREATAAMLEDNEEAYTMWMSLLASVQMEIRRRSAEKARSGWKCTPAKATPHRPGGVMYGVSIGVPTRASNDAKWIEHEEKPSSAPKAKAPKKSEIEKALAAKEQENAELAARLAKLEAALSKLTAA